MNTSRIALIALLALPLGACSSPAVNAAPRSDDQGAQAPKPSIAQLASEYKAAPEGNPRRDVCLKAIDLGYIDTTSSVETVRILFGADFREYGELEPGGLRTGIVNFTPMRGTNVPGTYASPYYVGWYLVVHYREKQIEAYHLTNTHK